MLQTKRFTITHFLPNQHIFFLLSFLFILFESTVCNGMNEYNMCLCEHCDVYNNFLLNHRWITCQHFQCCRIWSVTQTSLSLVARTIYMHASPLCHISQTYFFASVTSRKNSRNIEDHSRKYRCQTVIVQRSLPIKMHLSLSHFFICFFSINKMHLHLLGNIYIYIVVHVTRNYSN